MMRFVPSFLVTLALGASLLLIGGCESAADAERARHDRLVGFARRAAAEMVYVRDERTGLCYSFWWQRYDRSGAPTMANVPCDAVADRLENAR